MDKKISFENALARVGEIIKLLEKGEAPLDKTLELFSEGVELTSYCNTLLNEAEQKVTVLARSESGEIVEKPFSAEAGGNA